jgi:hypothetical protein
MKEPGEANQAGQTRPGGPSVELDERT